MFQEATRYDSRISPAVANRIFLPIFLSTAALFHTPLNHLMFSVENIYVGTKKEQYRI